MKFIHPNHYKVINTETNFNRDKSFSKQADLNHNKVSSKQINLSLSKDFITKFNFDNKPSYTKTTLNHSNALTTQNNFNHSKLSVEKPVDRPTSITKLLMTNQLQPYQEVQYTDNSHSRILSTQKLTSTVAAPLVQESFNQIQINFT